MKLIASILLFFIATTFVQADHIVGGEIYYDCLGNGQYRVTLKIYRDCSPGTAPFDAPLHLGVFDNTNNSYVRTENFPFSGAVNLPAQFSNPCVEPPTNICIQEAKYEKIVNLPFNQAGYTLAYQRCCRGPSIVNLLYPDDDGLTLSTVVPGSNQGALCNSSPRFDNLPPFLLCNNDEFIFDHSATDPDGDLIVYEFDTPLHGGSQAVPAPNPPGAPPYQPVVWENGFSANNAFGQNIPINIDAATGMINAFPQNLGLYVVCVTAKEYRNGILINETKRDFLFTVLNCVVSVEATIVEQEELSSFNSYCQGLTWTFENSSYGGTNYYWDFGVQNDPNANSTSFQPTYTFPAEGEYDITLVVNPGWPCTDTVVETFLIYEDLMVNFDPPSPQCITDNVFDFQGEGTYDPTTAEFYWDFGISANLLTDSTENPIGIQFDTPGYHPVVFEVSDKGCDGIYFDSVFVFQLPTINFGIEDDLYCAPFSAFFLDSSNADTPIEYFWEFGDGSTSTVSSPVHVYENPGIYDVQLTISTNDGCIDTLNLLKNNLIEVFPSPIADFSVTPEETDAFNTEIFFSDFSIDSETHFYYFNDTVFTTDRSTSFNYVEGGYHYPMQLVINEFGCRDSVYRTIYVEPQTTLYVPNAFTPDDFDNINPVFLPIVLDVKDYRFVVYNRLGRIIFETGDTKSGWDGTYKGVKVQDGVYPWFIRFRRAETDLWEEHRGHVTLVR